MRKALAYARALAERRARRERVGLVVVSLHDWNSGKWFDDRPEVARLVLPADVPVDAADWSVCLACDVLLCGSAPDPVFYAACDALAKFGAASVWGAFDDGVHLIERCGKSWVSVDGPFAAEKLGAALRRQRTAAVALRLGVYASRVYDSARAAMVQPMIEALAEQ
jgi:hypothetical protein